MENEKLNRLSKELLDAAIEVHREMGPGLLESVYEACLIEELKLRNIATTSQVELPLVYKGKKLSKEFRLDLLVEQEIVVELKTANQILPLHEAQIISYLKLADKRLGFLINFNVPLLKQGFKRFVNNF
ncbi:MAG: GxxExxY protein [Bacteroidetes bacterium]|nr:GxxExxY protein [Bacteroidota bacterium]MBU1116628.1 GxxExxY protein [Bacteroidota bacterium]MBU1797745.1 GxxExxY protein [Bacteroidota bacterium]